MVVRLQFPILYLSGIVVRVRERGIGRGLPPVVNEEAIRRHDSKVMSVVAYSPQDSPQNTLEIDLDFHSEPFITNLVVMMTASLERDDLTLNLHLQSSSGGSSSSSLAWTNLSSSPFPHLTNTPFLSTTWGASVRCRKMRWYLRPHLLFTFIHACAFQVDPRPHHLIVFIVYFLALIIDHVRHPCQCHCLKFRGDAATAAVSTLQ